MMPILTLALMSMLARADAEPIVVQRTATPYVSIKTKETMSSMATVFPRLMPKLHQWMAAHHVQQTGPEFIRYNRVDMDNSLDIEIGCIVSKSVKGDSTITGSQLPAGKYVSLTHFGNYSGLVAPNAHLQVWAKDHGHKFKMRKAMEFVSRLELYKTDPDKEPNPAKWETEILYMIGG